MAIRELNKDSGLSLDIPSRNFDVDRGMDSQRGQHTKMLTMKKKTIGFLQGMEIKLGDSLSNTERSNNQIKDQMKRLVKTYLNRSMTKKVFEDQGQSMTKTNT